MSEFVKPTKVIIDPTEYITELLKDGLEKDLHDNEEVCERCHGTGIVKTNNRYGLSDDPERRAGNYFPYKHQSITFCPNCYNGIARRCEHCGGILQKGRLVCDCDAVKEQRWAEREAKAAVVLAKAQEHNADALGTTFGMCYSDNISSNEGYFSDWEDFFSSWDDTWYEGPGSKEPENRPQWVWGTHKTTLAFDADSILENATDDMHESARDNIGSAGEKALQALLDGWADEYGSGAVSYDQSTKHKVRIPWEDYDGAC